MAASAAASNGLTGSGDKSKDPMRNVLEQMMISCNTSWQRILTRLKQIKNIIYRKELLKAVAKWLNKLFFNKNKKIKTKKI
jgi:hypothetical protein